MKHTIFTLSCLGLGFILSADEKPAPKLVAIPVAVKKKIDFQRDVQPILAKHCLTCHGPKRRRAGLRLDTRKLALEGGNSGGVLKPGNALESKLFQVVAGLHAEIKMPPESRKPLSKQELSVMRAWIDQGLLWPNSAAKIDKPTSDHWAFQTPKRPALPEVKNRSWPRNPLDRFVLATLEREGIAPSPEADRATLIRRLSFDLLGLPPTPEDVDAFVHDANPDAYERLVERLLASPRYGERWGRHWLDAARYADSDGYEKDRPRPFAWRWRNWVIKAFNRDLSYDQFVIEQLAGDLLPDATTEQIVATGFHRNTLTNTEGGVDQEEFRVKAVFDRVSTTGTVFLGLTIGCAQCHDHKYDPLTQREHYQLFAFFNSDVEANVPAPVAGREHTKKQKPPTARTLKLGTYRKTHVMIRGDFLRPGAEVKANVPAVLTTIEQWQGFAEAKKPATRLDVAKWIVDDRNPLASRVIVNWTWHKFFGRGIVATLEDFGTRAEKPSHPQLLDWLATEMTRRKWSLKSLHRLIVTSATYRQSSNHRPELKERDPLNVLLARQRRLRFEAEIIRDNALSVSGLLTDEIGGPSVRPPQPSDIAKLTYANSAKWVESKGANRYRRGLYTWFQRTSPYPMLMTFDAPDSNVCAVRRERSCTPLQALTLLNDRVLVECAQQLGARVFNEMPSASADRRMERLFRICFGRKPSARELARLIELREELARLAREIPAEAKKLTGGASVGTKGVPQLASWIAVARVLMNLDEFVTRE